jgi:pimeloyl-ACP methyl ester carboxylesterase
MSVGTGTWWRPSCVVVVGHSFGGFTAPLVADRLPVDVLVLVAGMIPSPGEAPGDWWENTGYEAAVREQAARDGGKTGNEDPYVSFYHDVPHELAEEAMRKEQAHPSEASMVSPWPLDAWPNVPSRSCCAPRIVSSRPRSFVGWQPNASASRPTRSRAATVSRSVAQGNWRTSWSATRPDLEVSSGSEPGQPASPQLRARRGAQLGDLVEEVQHTFCK